MNGEIDEKPLELGFKLKKIVAKFQLNTSSKKRYCF